MITIVAGSRTFTDKARLFQELDLLHATSPVTEIISGGAKGADRLGELWAKERGIPVKVFPANWNLHGKKAGYLRNMDMASKAQRLVAFWDGESKGTGHMINIARDRKLVVHIHGMSRELL